MSDLISRQAVIDLIMETDPFWCEGMTRTIFDGINRLPSVDALHVKRGKWIKADSQQYFRKHYPCFTCSECGYRKDSQKNWNYCPNCGARMDEE